MEDVEHGYRSALVAADGQLLCGPCHDEKTARKSGERAHGVRIVEKLANIDRRSTSSGQRGFSQRYKRKMNGDVLDTETGEIIRKGR